MSSWFQFFSYTSSYVYSNDLPRNFHKANHNFYFPLFHSEISFSITTFLNLFKSWVKCLYFIHILIIYPSCLQQTYSVDNDTGSWTLDVFWLKNNIKTLSFNVITDITSLRQLHTGMISVNNAKFWIDTNFAFGKILNWYTYSATGNLMVVRILDISILFSQKPASLNCVKMIKSVHWRYTAK